MFHFYISKPGRVLYMLVLVFVALMILGFLGKALFRPTENEAATDETESDIVINNDSIGAQDYSWVLDDVEDAGATVAVSGSPSEAAGGISISAWQPFEAAALNNMQILIYHTHTFEAYKNVNNAYEETGEARTKDYNYNVVAVGNELAKELSSKYGVQAIHDTKNHEEPKLATAYSRSLVTLEDYNLEPGAVMIDIHRDAYSQSSWDPEYVVINGKRVARIMMVVGKGANYEKQPDWKKNLAFAQRITDELNAICPGLAREVDIKDGRYNQHLSPNAVLIEVGHHENTLQEALNAVPYVARALMNALGQS